MGFPSSKSEAYYRNPLPDVFKFFEYYHKDNYKLYNLCAERSYDPSKFHNRVVRFPFFDHNAPPIKLIQDCCIDIHKWLTEDAAHIVGINCKAGKGRTGLIICCYMLHSGACESTDAALEMYGHKRTKDGKGVTIASQIRYIRYYERLLKEMNQTIPIPPKLTLLKLHITSSPKINGNGDQYVIIEMNNKVTHRSKEMVVERKKKNYNVPVDGVVEGDCKITLAIYTGNKKVTKICHFWFNTGFVDNYSLRLKKSEIDVANKDKRNKVFKEDFAIEGVFGPFIEKEEDEKKILKKIDAYEESSQEIDKLDISDDEKSDGQRKRSKSFYDYEEYKDLNIPDLESEGEISTDESDDDRSKRVEKYEKQEKQEKNGEKKEKSEKITEKIDKKEDQKTKKKIEYKREN